MSRFTASALLLLLACSANAYAQYKWVGPDGRVNYSDQPPPDDAKKVMPIERRGGEIIGDESSGLPYALQQAARNFPVTLYVQDNCNPCLRAREHLKKRGVPYAERTVNTEADQAAMRKAGGGEQLPFLTAGKLTTSGYESGAWNELLDNAGYPKSSVLPPSYRQMPARPAGGNAAPAAAPAAKSKS